MQTGEKSDAWHRIISECRLHSMEMRCRMEKETGLYEKNYCDRSKRIYWEAFIKTILCVGGKKYMRSFDGR